MSEEFGKRVADARQQAGLTQTQLANRLGRTRSTVANVEAGRQNPGIDQAVRIAQVLSVSVGWLLNAEAAGPDPRPSRASYLSPDREGGWPGLADRLPDPVHDGGQRA